MTLTPERQAGIARLKLALKIGFGGYSMTREISRADRELLQVELDAPFQEVLNECAEVIFAWMMELVPDEAAVNDDEALAAALLLEIQAAGGMLRFSKLKTVPPQLLKRMEDARLIRGVLNGVVWGFHARQALSDWQSKQNPNPMYNSGIASSDKVQNDEEAGKDERR